MESLKNYLKELLLKNSPEQAISWLESKLEKIESTQSKTSFYLSFGSVPRYFGKDRLQLSSEDLETATKLKGGFNPSNWAISQTARVYLILHLPHEDPAFFQSEIEKLFSTADMGEQIALYSSLAIIPHPELFPSRAAEGIRTNIQGVFDAIALDNPFPADYLSEAAWNQMVLKAAFMDRPIYRIVGLEKRANPTLAKIISDFAHERWSAGRSVSPEFWRTFGPHLLPEMISDVERLLEDENILQRQAGFLVCSASKLPEAKALLANRSNLAEGEFSWKSIAEAWWQNQV